MLLTHEVNRSIGSYLMRDKHPGLILQGEKGIGKRMAADYIARKLLDTDNLMSCPDHAVVESINGTILLEQLDEIKRKSLYHPSSSKYKVFIIDDANTMNTYSQNSLLKLIEDGNATNIFIFVAHAPLINTIHSRCETIRVSSPSNYEVEEYFKAMELHLDKTIMKIADHRVGLYNLMLDDEKFVEDCKNIINLFFNMKNKRELLTMFGQVKEKDSNNFYEAYASEKVVMFIKYLRGLFVDIVYNIMEFPHVKELAVKHLFSIGHCLDIIDKLDEHIERMGIKGRYTKNDFFDLIRYMAS